jgi:pimeloyl-ACP methyl ester carboxylesterase
MLMKAGLKWVLGGLILVTLLVVIVPFLIPVPPLEDTSSRRALADEDSRFSEVSGLEVHFKEAGSGDPAFLLLHGFGASTFSWREVIEPLAEHGRVIAYDRPAFGLTERPLEWEGQNPYGPEAQVELVFELMDALELDQAVLVGNSAGGTVALQAALARPDRVSGLILVDAAVYTGGGAPALVRPLLYTPQMNHLGPLLARRIARDGDEFIRRAWHDPDRINPAVFAEYRKPLQVPDWDRALWELTKASRSADLEARLDQVVVPTLVITGDDDRIVPTEESLQLAAEIPGAVLAVLDECGHLPQEECPVQFLGAVRTFLGREGIDLLSEGG